MLAARDQRPRQGATLIVGASGLLGPYLMRAAEGLGPVVGLSRGGPDIAADCRDRCVMARVLRQVRPDAVIFAAALTDVERCEREPASADALNRGALADLVELLAAGTRLVYISTDQVYPDRPGLHRETATGPVNVYGRSKLAGEAAALRSPGALVLRTNLFGPSMTPGRTSLSDFMIDRLRSGEELRLFKDVLFSPLHLNTLSELVVELMAMRAEGVLNLGCRDGASKMAFGYLLAEHLGLPLRNVLEVEAARLSARAPRPLDMRLDVGRLEAVLNRRLPTLTEEVSKL